MMTSPWNPNGIPLNPKVSHHFQTPKTSSAPGVTSAPGNVPRGQLSTGAGWTGGCGAVHPTDSQCGGCQVAEPRKLRRWNLMAGVLPPVIHWKIGFSLKYTIHHHPAIFWYHHGYISTSGVSPDFSIPFWDHCQSTWATSTLDDVRKTPGLPL